MKKIRIIFMALVLAIVMLVPALAEEEISLQEAIGYTIMCDDTNFYFHVFFDQKQDVEILEDLRIDGDKTFDFIADKDGKLIGQIYGREKSTNIYMFCEDVTLKKVKKSLCKHKDGRWSSKSVNLGYSTINENYDAAQFNSINFEVLVGRLRQWNGEYVYGLMLCNDAAKKPSTQPTETPEPTATPGLTATPGPTATPGLTATPEPTATPGPTTTHEPTPTHGPTATPEPTPGPTHEPTMPPKPTPTPGRPTHEPTLAPTEAPDPTLPPKRPAHEETKPPEVAPQHDSTSGSSPEHENVGNGTSSEHENVSNLVEATLPPKPKK